MNIKNKIKSFWEEKGGKAVQGGLVTHGDDDQVKLEIDQISVFLQPDDELVDVGCGTGYSTAIYAEKCKKVTGLDYTDAMIQAAREAHQVDNLSFEVGNVLDLSAFAGRFTAALSTRCLINLETWEEQEKAIKNIHSCLKDNGRLILVEGTQQGRAALNELRVQSGLEAMPKVWHNIDFDEEKLIPLLESLFTIEEDVRFGVYDVLTRVLYPQMIAPKEPKYGSPYHKKARLLTQAVSGEEMKKYSREFVLVCRKK